MDQTSLIEQLMGLLNNLSEEKGVPKEQEIIDKNIAKSGSSAFDNNKVSPRLSPNEKRRLIESATLFSKIFLQEQARLLPDSRPDTIIAEAKRKLQPQPLPESSSKNEKNGWGSILSLLVGGVALVGAAIPAIIASLFEKVGPLADGMKILGKAGLMGGLSMIVKGLGKTLAPLLKRIPIVGSLINFGFAYKEFKEKRYVPALLELGAGLVNLVPGIGTPLSFGIDMLKIFLDSQGAFNEGGILSNENAWGTIKGWAASIGKFLWDNALWFPILGSVKRFGMAKDAFDGGNMKDGLYQLGMGILSFGAAPLVKGMEVLMGFLGGGKEPETGDLSVDTSWSSRLKKWIKDKLKDLPYVIRKPLEWFGLVEETEESEVSWDGVQESAKKGFESVKNFMVNAWDKIKDPIQDGISGIVDITKDTWEKTKKFSVDAWDKMKEELPKITTAFKKNIKDISSNIHEKIVKWAPEIKGMFNKVIDKSPEVVRNITDKMGSWVGNVFDSTKKMEIKNPLNNPNLQNTINAIKSSNVKDDWSAKLYECSKMQVKLLSDLVNIGTQSYRELAKISGKGGGGSSSVSVIPTPQGRKTPSVTMGDGRGDYMTSPYSLA